MKTLLKNTICKSLYPAAEQHSERQAHVPPISPSLLHKVMSYFLSYFAFLLSTVITCPFPLPISYVPLSIFPSPYLIISYFSFFIFVLSFRLLNKHIFYFEFILNKKSYSLANVAAGDCLNNEKNGAKGEGNLPPPLAVFLLQKVILELLLPLLRGKNDL